jgi:hypothetical protein
MSETSEQMQALLHRIRAVEELAIDLEERWVRSQSGADPRAFAVMHGTHLEQRIQDKSPAVVPALRKLWARVIARFL